MEEKNTYSQLVQYNWRNMGYKLLKDGTIEKFEEEITPEGKIITLYSIPINKETI